MRNSTETPEAARERRLRWLERNAVTYPDILIFLVLLSVGLLVVHVLKG